MSGLPRGGAGRPFTVMLKKLSVRHLVIVLIAATLLGLVAVRASRSTRARGWVARGVAPVVWLWTPVTPTRDELRTVELTQRQLKRMPRPARAPYPDRPRVALMDFGIDVNSWMGDQHARKLSTQLRERLTSDPAAQWVDHAQLHAAARDISRDMAMAPGTELGAGHPAWAVEIGAKLDCQLIVTGQWINATGDAPQLRLTVIDLLTAGRVAEIQQPWSPDPERAGFTDLDALETAVRSLVKTAHTKLAQQHDAPVVSLLFFRNRTDHHQLDHVEAALPQSLEQCAGELSGPRLVQVTRPGSHGLTQGLALVGLTRRAPQAWACAADYYLWGSYDTHENDPSLTTVTLNLWSGFGMPRTFTGHASAGDIDAVVDRLAHAAWQAAQKPARPEVCPDQCKTVVDELTQRLAEDPLLTALSRPRVKNATGRQRDAATRQLAYQASCFFRPDDVSLARHALMAQDPQPLTESTWLGLRAREAHVDQVINRVGPAVADDWGIMLQKLDVLVRRSALFVAATGQSRAAVGPDGGEMPRDMPPQALRAQGLDIIQRMGAFGRLCSRNEMAPEGLPLRAHPSSILLENMLLTHEQTAELWTQWWPYFRPQWEQQRTKPDRSYYTPNFLKTLAQAYTAAGRQAEYQAMFGELTVSARSSARDASF